MKPFKLIIFDCDGVLVDSEPIIMRVVATMLTECGLAVCRAELFDSLHGHAEAEWLTLLTERFGKSLPADFVPTLRQRAAAALWAEVTPIPGAGEALAQIQLPVCVASNGEEAKLQLTLGKTGLLAHFGRNLFSVSDVERPKPAPDLYLYAARQNGVAPEACAVIEDSPAGVRAGVAAGMTVFGFAGRTPVQQLQAAGAQVIFTAMQQLPALLTAAPSPVS